MSFPSHSINCVANLFAKQMHFAKAGDSEDGHKHEFDHLTLLASGAVRLTVDGRDTDFKAPHMIYIHAEKNHKLTALEDNTVAYCIHALRDGDGVGDIIDPASIPFGVDPFSIAKSLTKVAGQTE